MSRAPSYDLRACGLEDVRPMVERHHGYGSLGSVASYVFAVFEDEAPVAGYVWMPPPLGAAKSVCPEAPHGVLALTRMVAVPRDERTLNHISKPLRRQMRTMIDRGRWPVLVTFHDEGQGHTGHVYKCSGWTATTRALRPFHTDEDGRRVSSYSDGRTVRRKSDADGATWLQRWEHWACVKGAALAHMRAAGWFRVETGRRWASGRPACTTIKVARGHGVEQLTMPLGLAS